VLLLLILNLGHIHAWQIVFLFLFGKFSSWALWRNWVCLHVPLRSIDLFSTLYNLLVNVSYIINECQWYIRLSFIVADCRCVFLYLFPLLIRVSGNILLNLVACRLRQRLTCEDNLILALFVISFSRALLAMHRTILMRWYHCILMKIGN